MDLRSVLWINALVIGAVFGVVFQMIFSLRDKVKHLERCIADDRNEHLPQWVIDIEKRLG